MSGKLYLHAPVTRRLLRALVEAPAGLCLGEMIAATYGARPAPTARHSLGVLLRRLQADGIRIENPARGSWRLAEVSRETVVSILGKHAALRDLAAELGSSARVQALLSQIRPGEAA